MKKSTYGVAALLFACSLTGMLYAEDSTDQTVVSGTETEEVTTAENHAAMWNNNGNPGEEGKTPLDFGWEGWNGETQITSNFGKMDGGGTRFRSVKPYVGETFPHLLLHFQTTAVSHFGFPLADIEPGKSYEVKVLIHRHNSEDQYLGIGINSKANGTGNSYYSSSNPTPTGAWTEKRFYFTAGGDADETYYIIFYKSNGTLNLSSVADIQVVESEPFSTADASETNPIDVTWKYISNQSFESELLDWTNGGMKVATSGDFGYDGLKFIDQWVSSSNNLSDVKISRILTGLEPGKYSLKVRAENYKSGVETTGGYIYAGDTSVEVREDADYSADFVILDGSDGSVEIGAYTKSTNANWFAVDNFRLYYLGEAKNAEKTLNVTVANYRGVAIEGAEVSFSAVEEAVTTDAEGKASFTFHDDDLSNLSLTVKAAGYADYTQAVEWGGTPTQNVTVSLTETQPMTGNLLGNALHGIIGSKPNGWVNYNRAGEQIEDRALATLRDENSSASNTAAEPYYFMLRWDDAYQSGDDESRYTSHDRYYTYKVTIPESGVYDFTMKSLQFSEWKGQDGNQYSQMPDKSALRVTLATTPGYDYSKTQSLVFDMNNNNPANLSNWIDCSGKFYAEAGEYYLSFTGSHALYPVRELSLVKDESSTLTSMPEATNITFEVAEEAGEPVGGYTVSVGDGAEVEYIYFEGEDTVKARTYGPWGSDKNVTVASTLYAYEVVDGVHSALVKKEFSINAPVMTVANAVFGEGFSVEGQVVTLVDDNATVTFDVPEYETVMCYLETAQTGAKAAADEEADNAVSEPAYIDGTAGFIVTEAGTLHFYPVVNGVSGEEVTVLIDKEETGVSELNSDNSVEKSYYNLNGVKVSADRLEKGIYIVRQGGKVTKEIR